MTDTLPTKDELLDPTDDYAKLRIAAGEVLHGNDERCCVYCRKLHTCPFLSVRECDHKKHWLPRSATGPLEVITAALVKKVDKSALCKAVITMNNFVPANDPDEETRLCCDAWYWLLFCETAERCVCCLVGLGKARLTPCHPPSAPGPFHKVHRPGDDTCSRNWKSLNDLVNKVLTAP